MPNDFSSRLLLGLTLVYFSIEDSKGNALGHGKEFTNVTRNTIEDLRQNLKRVLHFINHLSGNVTGTSKLPAGDKSRSAIPPLGVIGAQWLADESVVKATAKKAAKAVKESFSATLKTQKGMQRVAKGLVKLKKCLDTFENTIQV